MAWTVRTAVFKLPSNGVGVLHKVIPNTKNVAFMQAAGISTKYVRSIRPPPDFDRPKPYDYVNKSYGVFAQLFDRMMYRFDDNSKIVVVDGTIASGKTEVAKALADEFEMLHLPAVSSEELYINECGYDFRKLNNKVSPGLQCVDVELFLKNPHHVNAAFFQVCMYVARYFQYVHALEHVLNTGQGVVLERCPWSNVAFINAMVQAGYVTSASHSYYKEMVKNSMYYLMRPNLIVYLDAPVETVQEKIKRRGIPYEVNSKVFTKEYLQSIENNTKSNYLKPLSTHAEILIYDWSNGGDIGSMVHDIERINFETDRKDPKHADWKYDAVDDVRRRRVLYTRNKLQLMHALEVDQILNPDTVTTAEEEYEMSLIMLDLESEGTYEEGYNPVKGDKVFWKL